MGRFIVCLFFLGFVLNPAQAYAADAWGGCVVDGVATLTCIPIIFNNVINWIITFGGVIALFYLIYGGFKFVQSGGEEEKVKSARQTITYAIIGLVIMLLSFGIVNIIGSITGTTCISQFGFGNCAP